MYWAGTDLFMYNVEMAKEVDFYALMPNNSKAISRRSKILSETKERTGRKAVALNLVKRFYTNFKSMNFFSGSAIACSHQVL